MRGEQAARSHHEPKPRKKKPEAQPPAEVFAVESTSEGAERLQQEQAAEQDKRNAENVIALNKKIVDLRKQKELNLKSTGLNEAMIKKINAEIDKNIADLGRQRDAAEGIVTSAPAAEALTSDRPAEAREPLEPRKPGEQPRTYGEHKEDMEKVLSHIEKAGEPKEVDIDLTELNAEVAKAKAEAEEKTEAEFFARGEAIDKGHALGLEQVHRTEAERRGDAGAERHEMSERAEKLRSQMPAMQEQLARAERVLAGMGVKDIDEAMAKRATGGMMEKAKGFFGGLFSKKTREMQRAMDLYAAIRDDYNARQSELNELDNRANAPEQFRQAMQLKGERKSPTGR